MSKERELLKQVVENFGYVQDIHLIVAIQKLLNQPKREPLSDEEITKAFMQSDFGTWDSKSYRSGFRDAEKHHGIGGGE